MIAYLKRDAGSGNYTLRVVTAGGSDVEVDAGWCRFPMWSPDSSLIIYSTYDTGDEHKVFTVEPDGSNKTAIYTHPSTPATISRPCYNADGTLIAFQNENANTIYVANADGSGANLIDTIVDADEEGALSWAHNSDRLAYANGGAFANAKWYVINADGSGKTQIGVDTAVNDSILGKFAWALDDSVVIGPRWTADNRWRLMAMDPAGGGQADLSPTARVFDQPILVMPNGRVYFLAYIEPVFAGVDFESVEIDGSDRRVEDSASAVNILLEFFI